MKKIFIMAGVGILIACNDSQPTEEANSKSPENPVANAENLVYPYSVNFTNFKADDQKNTQVALNLWKLWDDGDLTKQKELWADSAEVHTWDGLYIKGSRDSISSSGKAFRSNFSSVVSSVNGVISFSGTNKATGKDENWAAVWGKRIMIDKTGKADSVWLHEAWRMNNNGQAEALYQFAAKISSQ